MRFILGLLAAVLVGLAIGGASALIAAGLWPAKGGIGGISAVTVDGWRADLSVGSETANPYTRARVARHGLLGLAQSEAIYFVRSADDKGQPLRETCTYRLSGKGQDARWWSITLYDADSRLPMNDDDALSVDASALGEGAWSVMIAPQRPEEAEHWISSNNAGTFDLTLRLYVPSPALLENPARSVNAPRISRLGCVGDA